MKNTLKSAASMAGLLLLSLAFTACQKGIHNGNDSTDFAVFLTDGPADYDAVNIDIKTVEVKVDTCNGRKNDDKANSSDKDGDDNHRSRDEYGKWDTLDFNAGIYDVATLRNGIDTLLATGTVNGRIRKIRLSLGTSNTIVVNGVTHPLLTFLGDSSRYLYVKVEDAHRNHSNSGEEQVWIDFDINRSIIAYNGQYYLKPVIKPFCDKNFGTLIGKVLPEDAATVVNVFNGTDAASAVPEKNGFFKIRGLKPGTYTVTYDGSNGYTDTVLTNVIVTAGKPLTLAPVTLKK